MSTDRGVRMQRWIADYLRRWWPAAEAVGSGRRGNDILGIPGIHWEVKTSNEFRPNQWAKQAADSCGPNLPIVVYVPNGMGQQTVENAMCMIPLHRMVGLLDDAGYTPDRAPASAGGRQ